MDTEKTTISNNIGRVTALAERSADIALADAAEMLSKCVRARAVLQLPAHEGQRGVIALGKAVNQLIGVQGNLRHAHAEAKRIGSEFVLGPDSDDCPWPDVVGGYVSMEETVEPVG